MESSLPSPASASVWWLLLPGVTWYQVLLHVVPQPPSPTSDVTGDAAGWCHQPNVFLLFFNCFPLHQHESPMAVLAWVWGPHGCTHTGVRQPQSHGDASPLSGSASFHECVSSHVLKDGWHCPHVTSTLFPFLSQNTSLPHMSPAPAAAFFNYIWSEVLWAPLTGCSFGVLTVVQKSAGPWGDQPQTSCSQGPCSHLDPVEI